jgi:hypothetical protein
MSNPGWQDDLLGGRDKVYNDKDGNEVRLSQDSEQRAENEARGKGEYPHYTGNWKGDSSWHRSDDSKSHEFMHSYAENDDSDSEPDGENNSVPLF